MKMTEMYPSKWLKAEDFEENETRTLTIDTIAEEMIGQGRDASNKYVLYFREDGAKPMVLNKTNASIISKLYGNDTDDWAGSRITLFTMDVQSFDDIVRGLRVKPRVPSGGASAPAAKPSSADPFDDTLALPISNEQKMKITTKATQVWPDRARMLEGIKDLWSGNVNNLSSEEAEAVIKKLDGMIAEVDDDDPFADGD